MRTSNRGGTVHAREMIQIRWTPVVSISAAGLDAVAGKWTRADDTESCGGGVEDERRVWKTRRSRRARQTVLRDRGSAARESYYIYI
jgi:hypothetical protein